MSDVKINCPECGQRLEVPRELLGTVHPCPACKKSLQLPARDGHSSESPSDIGSEVRPNFVNRKEHPPSPAPLWMVAVVFVPFSVLGLSALLAGMYWVLEGFPPAAILIVFGAIIETIAVGLFKRQARERRAQRLLREHPDRPWLRHPHWHATRIADSSVLKLCVAWGIAICFCPFALLPLLAPEGEKAGAWWYAGIFGLPSLTSCVFALYYTVRRLRFGKSVLVPDTVPGPLGGILTGTVRTSSRLANAEGVEICLQCVSRKTRRKGREYDVDEFVLREVRQFAPQTILAHGRSGETLVPIYCPIPGDAVPTTARKLQDGTHWRLSLRAPLQGVDYSASFEVPVFHTGEVAAPDPQRLALYAKPAIKRATSFRVSPAPGGGKAFDLLPTRAGQPTIALGFAVVAAVVFCLGGYIGAAVVPIAGAALGLLGALLAFVSWAIWAHRTRIVAKPGKLILERGIPGRRRPKEIHAQDIEKMEIGVPNRSLTGKDYYDIFVWSPTYRWKVYHLASKISGKEEAEMLLDMLQQEMASPEPS